MPLKDLAQSISSMPPVRVPSDIIGHQSPSLIQVDRDTAAAYIAAAAYKELTARYSIPVEMDHCRVWADDMIDRYPSLRLAEIRSIIRHMATIPLFNRIDVQILTQAADQYYRYRTAEIADIREREHQNRKVKGIGDTEKIFVAAPDYFKERTKELERQLASQRRLTRMVQQKREQEFEKARKELAAMIHREDLPKKAKVVTDKE